MEEKSRVILILNIKLDNNRSDDLQIFEDDEPEMVAENFCKKHKLPIHVKQILIKNIEDNLDEFIKEELGNDTTVLSSIVSGVKASNTSTYSHNRSSSAKNYGEVLYDKGIMMKQKVEHMVQIHKQNNLEKELKNSTFTPKINNYQPRPRTHSSKPANKRHQRLLDQTNTCTFKPKINDYRLKKKENSQASDKCIELYNNAKNIKQRKEEKNLKL